MTPIREFLQQRRDAVAWSIGQLSIAGTIIRHLEDVKASGLEVFRRPEDARELAKYDDAGIYRPLRTAPNLRHGWQLELASLDDLRLALDFFYPAALGTSLAYERGELPVLPLRATLGRQSGMYRVTQLITDEQAEALIQKVCRDGCIRHRLWDVNSAIENQESEIKNSEVLCAEACNLLVAACRPVAKQNLPKTEPTA